MIALKVSRGLSVHDEANIPPHGQVNLSWQKSTVFLLPISLFKKGKIIAAEMHEITGSREITPHDVDTPCRSAGRHNHQLTWGIAMEELCVSGDLSSFPLS
jgi:hypothetical protein